MTNLFDASPDLLSSITVLNSKRYSIKSSALNFYAFLFSAGTSSLLPTLSFHSYDSLSPDLLSAIKKEYKLPLKGYYGSKSGEGCEPARSYFVSIVRSLHAKWSSVSKLSLFLESHNSQVIDLRRTLSLAAVYKDRSIYFVYRSDFRGRLYSCNTYLSPTYSRFSRVLLCDVSRTPLVSSNILVLPEHLHKCLKIKSSFTWPSFKSLLQPILSQFVYTASYVYIESVLCELQRHFHVDLDFIEQGYFLEFVLLYTRDGIILSLKEVLALSLSSDLLVELDASSSGSQHLSLIYDNESILYKSNVINTSSFKEDLYSYIAGEIQSSLSHSVFKFIELTRSDVKKVVMTILYNLSYYGLRIYLEDMFVVIKNKSDLSLFSPVILLSSFKEGKHYLYYQKSTCSYILLTNKDYNKFCSLFYSKLLSCFSIGEDLKSVMSCFVDLHHIFNSVVVTHTPILNISHDYRIIKQPKVYRKGSRKFVRLFLPSDVIDYRKIKQSCLANIIHSFDSNVVHFLNLFCKEGPYSNLVYYTVHDAFFVNINHITTIKDMIKFSYILTHFSSIPVVYKANLVTISDLLLKEELDMQSFVTVLETQDPNLSNDPLMNAFFHAIYTEVADILEHLPDLPKDASIKSFFPSLENKSTKRAPKNLKEQVYKINHKILIDDNHTTIKTTLISTRTVKSKHTTTKTGAAAKRARYTFSSKLQRKTLTFKFPMTTRLVIYQTILQILRSNFLVS